MEQKEKYMQNQTSQYLNIKDKFLKSILIHSEYKGGFKSRKPFKK